MVLWCVELKYETGAFEELRKLDMVFAFDATFIAFDATVFAFDATKFFAHSVLETPLLDLYEFLTFSYDIID